MSRWPASALLLLLAGVLPVSPAGAARLPDWAQQQARTAPALPAGVPSHDERFLLSETRLTVGTDGTFRIRRRTAVQVVSATGAGIRVDALPFRHGARLEPPRVWHLPPGSRVERGTEAAVDVSHPAMFLGDERVRLVHIDGIRKGSLVFFELTATQPVPVLVWRHAFAEPGPVSVARLEVELPAGWLVRHGWTRHAGPPPVVRETLSTWELHDVVPAEEEPFGPAPADAVPLIYLAVVPSAPLRVPALASWAALATWWETLSRGRHQPTPEITTLAREIAAGAGADPLTRIARSVAYVRDRVRYVAIELGVGAWQPRPAHEVLSRMLGDCKDKATLLRAVLAAQGIDSYPVLVSAMQRDTVSEEVPAPQAFDHLVLAVALPPGASGPGAVLDGHDLGALLVVDPTQEDLSPGTMSPALAGKRGFLLAHDRSRLVTLPTGSSETNRVERRLEISPGPSGRLAVRETTRYRGAAALAPRAETRRGLALRRRAVEERIAETWIGATLEGHEVIAEDAEGALLETVVWSAPGPAADATGHVSIPLFPAALEDLWRVALGRRRGPVHFPYPMGVRHETVVTTAQHEGTLPGGLTSRGAGWSVESHVAAGSTGPVGTWEARLDDTQFEPEQFAELRAFWSAAGRAAAATVPLPGGLSRAALPGE